jgi:multiple sugar transport system permease protein
MLQTYVTTFTDLNFGGGYALSLLVTVATALLSMGALALFYRRAEAA